ncbi:hypothetical protein HYS91_03260 [Candidatus Daviesbacteria bacterium]|nr:hypothetical protein [Candidatus Daviesbacteria bacterium]
MSRKQEIAKNILIALGMIGLFSAVMIAPGLAKVLPLLSKIDVGRINQEIKRLQKRGLIEVIKRRNGLTSLKLTSKGKEKLKRYEIDNLKIERPQHWDKKWRMVIFDIPVDKNSSRLFLRRKMNNLGFYKLQKSVFVHPYPCYEIVIFLRNHFGVSNEVEYIEATNLESQDKLVKHFFT